MRTSLVAALALFASAASARAADGRFFLFLAEAPPQPELVRAGWRESQKGGPLAPEVARERLTQVFPRLFASGRNSDKSALEADLKAGRAAHFAGQYQEAETAFAKALDAARDEPELLEEPKLLQRLVDGAATRYKNTLSRKKPKTEARAQIAAFLTRYPLAAPTASDHAPEVMTVWNELRAAAKKAARGSIAVNVMPLDLERGGSCKLSLNGAEVATLPQPGPLEVPPGEHFVQVRCGAQRSWLQRVSIAEGAALALQVPVRAMLSARADAGTGGIVMVAPAEGDAAALVQALSRSADLAGAVVAVAGPTRVKLGRWDPASAEPALASVGRIEGADITKVKVIGAEEDEGSGRLWTWIVGGVGLATLGGAVAMNIYTADEINAGNPDTDGLKTTTIALYAVGGALVATGIILFFVEGDADDEDGEASWSPGPGGVMVRF